MFRKAFAALAAITLLAQPALAQDRTQPKRDSDGRVSITRQTLLPLGIIVGLAAVVVALTLHTRKNQRTSP